MYFRPKVIWPNAIRPNVLDLFQRVSWSSQGRFRVFQVVSDNLRVFFFKEEPRDFRNVQESPMVCQDLLEPCETSWNAPQTLWSFLGVPWDPLKRSKCPLEHPWYPLRLSGRSLELPGTHQSVPYALWNSPEMPLKPLQPSDTPLRSHSTSWNPLGHPWNASDIT